MKNFIISLNKKNMISQKTLKNSETISRTVWEHFNVLRRDENRFSEEQQ